MFPLKYFLLLVYGALQLNTVSAQDSSVWNFSIGDTGITVIEKCFGQCTSSVTFINVHDNEKTAVRAVKTFLNKRGGCFLRVENDSQRNCSFLLNGKRLFFDPNRIYTRQGRIKTLKLLTKDSSVEAEALLSSFAERLLNTFITGSTFIVALHNNTDSNYSLLTYVQQQKANAVCCRIHVNADMDPDDFILTTDTLVFKRLQQKNVNTVWEDVQVSEDDGSLSVYTALHNIPYVNIEAEHGHYEQQLALLEIVSEVIANIRAAPEVSEVKEEEEEEEISRIEYFWAPDK